MTSARHDLLEQLVHERVAAYRGNADQSTAAADGDGTPGREPKRGDQAVARGLGSTEVDSEATFVYGGNVVSENGERFSVLRPYAQGPGTGPGVRG